jgi:hypothetical protein
MAVGKFLYDFTFRVTPTSSTTASENLSKVNGADTTGSNVSLERHGTEVIADGDTLDIFPNGTPGELNFLGKITFDDTVVVGSRTVDINVDAVGNVMHHGFFAFRSDTSAVIANNTGKDITVQWIAVKPS